MAGCPEGDVFNVNVTDSNVPGSLVIGKGNTINIYNLNIISSRLHFPDYKSRHRRSARTLAIADCGGRHRDTKIKRQSKIRFSQRKFRADPRKASSESEEETIPFYLPEISSLHLGDAEWKDTESLDKFFPILNKLHPLRDEGSWNKFDRESAILKMANRGDRELEMLLLMEKSVIVSYQSDLEQAERMLLEVLKNVNTETKVTAATHYHFLVSMIHVHLCGFYRRQNKLDKAESSIAIAEQNSRKSRYLKALILYEMASNQTKIISTLSMTAGGREKRVSLARNYMKKCISLSADLDGSDVYLKKHHFGLLKLALMALNCRTRTARSQEISIECIEEGKNCLKTVEERYKDEMSQAQLIQFRVAKADLHWRQNNLLDAEMSVLHALHLAEKNGFSLEITGIKERLDDINISRLRDRSKKTTCMPLEISDENADTVMRDSPFSSDIEMEVE
ncbi:unnamed protein product [Porites evermanni]|uniref:Uncharacterized protein n=1 Tax=Porites evermanni TaxID=104178 RepID=A0ABN8SV83_9CNID|nr:unnamed protein product [Porites evermanni]